MRGLTLPGECAAGDAIEPGQAGALAGLERGTAAEAADALVAAGVLEHGRPLRFIHPLVRNAVYADLVA